MQTLRLKISNRAELDHFYQGVLRFFEKWRKRRKRRIFCLLLVEVKI